MKLNYLKNWLAVLAISVFSFATANAEIIYEDSFEGEEEYLEFWPIWGNPNFEADWYIIYKDIARSPTDAIRGDGNLTIYTEDKNSGVITPLSSDYNFFERELTFTFEGVRIEALGKSRVASEWARFGVVAYSNKTHWDAHSSVVISYNGAGTFQFGVKQPNIGTGFDTAPRKKFISRTFNFDVTYLSKIELTLDSVNYRVAFVFENEMDQLTFGGPHNLDYERWIVDTVGVGPAKKAMEAAAELLVTYQALYDDAVASGDQVAIDDVQARLAARQLRYNEYFAYYLGKAAEAAETKGRTALLMVASSKARETRAFSPPEEVVVDENGRIGAKLTIGGVKVEATSALEGL